MRPIQSHGARIVLLPVGSMQWVQLSVGFECVSTFTEPLLFFQPDHPAMTEIFIRKQKVRSGKTERLQEWIDDLIGAARSNSEGVRDIWEEETLQTMSLFVEHATDGDYLVWYLEAESVEQLFEARRTSGHPLHDIEDAMMEDVLENPEETGDFEPLLHGVNPERSTTFELQRYIEGSQ